jgi:hypothetical protein
MPDPDDDAAAMQTLAVVGGSLVAIAAITLIVSTFKRCGYLGGGTTRVASTEPVVEPPSPTEEKGKGPKPDTPEPKPKADGADAFKEIKAILKRISSIEKNDADTFRDFTISPDGGKLNTVRAYVNTITKTIQANKSYVIKKESAEANLAVAKGLEAALAIFQKTAPNPQTQSLSLTASLTADPSGGKWEVKQKPPPGPPKPRNTVVGWLGSFGGWTVKASGQSFFATTVLGNKIHISLPMEPEDSTAQVTESMARGIWVGRGLHVTWEFNARGSKSNPRIWWTGTAWKDSVGDVIPANGCVWLNENRREVLLLSGLEGTAIG